MTARVHSNRTGIEKDFFKLDFPPWVNIVASTEQNEIVLIRQYRFGTPCPTTLLPVLPYYPTTLLPYYPTTLTTLLKQLRSSGDELS